MGWGVLKTICGVSYIASSALCILDVTCCVSRGALCFTRYVNPCLPSVAVSVAV